jgi:predicted outer membrane repeat protein
VRSTAIDRPQGEAASTPIPPNLILENSTISSNSTTLAGGGLLIPAGSSEIGSDLFVGNSATSGGAIDAEGETASYLSVQSSRLSGNVASHGGAIDVAGSNASGHPVNFLMLLYDTLDGDRSLADGGALSVSFTGGGGNLWDDTFTSNSTGTGGAGTKGYGGAISLTTGDGTSGLNLVDLTINGNSASLQGGGIDQLSGTLSVENTIIAGDTASGSPSDYAYVGGTLTDKGANLLGSKAGSNNEFGVSTIVGNPILGQLEDNGGFIAGGPSERQIIPTEALLPGSPAIAKGIAGVMATDERLFPHLGTTAVPSIGAYWPQYASIATPNQVFAENLYDVLLNRTADSAGLAADTAFLSAGGTPLALVRILESSTEYLDDEVIDLYQRYLGRSPSPAETNAVAGLLKSGTTPEQVAASLVGSAEFYQDYGGDNDVFVQAAYHSVLGRSASTAEMSAWDQAMANGLSRPAAAAILLSSQEYLTDLIQDDFAADLGRPAQPADVSLFLSAAAMGATNPFIRAILLAASFGTRT